MINTITITTVMLFSSLSLLCFESPDLFMDICQSIFFALLVALETIKDFFVNNHLNKDEKENKDKGKGKATQEQLEQWDREAKASKKSFKSGGNDNDDDDDDDHKKREDVRLEKDRLLAQEEADRLLAKALQDQERYDSSHSTWYHIDINDDNLRAKNKKLDIKEFDAEEEAKTKKVEQQEGSSFLDELRKEWKKEVEEKKERKDALKRTFQEDEDDNNTPKKKKR